MGQATEKLKVKLASMGYGTLPTTFRLDGQFTLKDEASDRRLRKYTVLLNPEEVEAFLSQLQFRSAHSQHLMQVLFVETKKEEWDYCKLFVYLQQICLSLEEVVCTHFLNMVKILYSALHGFKALYVQYGYFAVESSMIGLNYDGVPKSWLSRKYTQHSPKSSYSYQKAARGQEAMVSELKDIFFCKVDKNTLPSALHFAAPTFDGMIHELKLKFGEELLQSKIDLAHKATQDTERPILNTITNNLAITSTLGTQLRFSYNNLGSQNRSSANISFNGQPTHPVIVEKISRVSVDKPKVSFSYSKYSTPISPLSLNIEPQMKELERTNHDSGIGNQRTLEEHIFMQQAG